jgi:hypothetical protein
MDREFVRLTLGVVRFLVRFDGAIEPDRALFVQTQFLVLHLERIYFFSRLFNDNLLLF